ncbi:methionine ABC transporter ATP-binding protein [Hydrogenibacillus schlegelii]|uniref:Methionine ABC transporter ATP-binding protein n=1 Tax=Hydrogenibacillus schlegelii TaxID=1484 RepID=A0A2T5GEQ0_HYDSH|nr:methionine ABC transporter ATP-binding protein [Hydrogenibacillus schlegelii]PTQ54653.1 MAG: Methionine ABC transporter ATP-binding protein [Hydrogenibacillus schlegelii]
MLAATAPVEIPPDEETIIRLENVQKVYVGRGAPVEALKNINLTIRRGEIFGVIGESGAGKSTLIRLINFLERPTGGRVWVDGVDLATLSPEALRKKRMKIGMIFQHFNLLWSRTVFENVRFPLELAGWPKDRAQARVEALLDLVGLRHRRDAYPAQLSGGEKQRVGIARALANEPDILLSDEATSALDPKTTDDILDLILSINRRFGITVVLITHEMHVIEKICDRVAVLDRGVIQEVGPVPDVFSRPKSAVARRFIAEVFDPPSDGKGASGPAEGDGRRTEALRLVFVGAVAEAPIIHRLIRSHDVEVNILRGEIKRLKDVPFGTLTVRLTGTPAELTAARAFLTEAGVIVEAVTPASEEVTDGAL